MGWVVEGGKHGQGSVLFFGFVCGLRLSGGGLKR
jgi:hypothetical protein